MLLSQSYSAFLVCTKSPIMNCLAASEIWPIKASATVNLEPWLICESNYVPVCNGYVHFHNVQSAIVSVCP